MLVLDLITLALGLAALPVPAQVLPDDRHRTVLNRVRLENHVGSEVEIWWAPSECRSSWLLNADDWADFRSRVDASTLSLVEPVGQAPPGALLWAIGTQRRPVKNLSDVLDAPGAMEFPVGVEFLVETGDRNRHTGSERPDEHIFLTTFLGHTFQAIAENGLVSELFQVNSNGVLHVSAVDGRLVVEGPALDYGLIVPALPPVAGRREEPVTVHWRNQGTGRQLRGQAPMKLFWIQRRGGKFITAWIRHLAEWHALRDAVLGDWNLRLGSHYYLQVAATAEGASLRVPRGAVLELLDGQGRERGTAPLKELLRREFPERLPLYATFRTEEHQRTFHGDLAPGRLVETSTFLGHSFVIEQQGLDSREVFIAQTGDVLASAGPAGLAIQGLAVVTDAPEALQVDRRMLSADL